LGEYVAGSSEAFVKMMNDKAKSLGMKNTHFDNCTGLDDDTKNQLSSAYDIALMSKALMKYDIIKKYSKIWMDSLRNGKTELVNTNRLVRFYEGCTGLKTGTTTKAGFCVSATASRDGTNLCAVILGSDTSEHRFAAASKLLNWGFANFQSIKPKLDLSQAGEVRVNGGTQESIIPSVPENSVSLLVEKGRGGKVENEVLLEKNMTAPIEKGQIIGRVNFYISGKKIGSADILNQNYIPKLTFGDALKKLIESTVTNF
jgi:D-alanyl-D-alanine carboxypeptidase (penicillin-binding protein 5/6)